MEFNRMEENLILYSREFKEIQYFSIELNILVNLTEFRGI